LRSIRSFKRREQYEIAAGKTPWGKRRRTARRRSSKTRKSSAWPTGACENESPPAEILVMRYSGMAYKEIAKTLHLSPLPSVRSAASRTRVRKNLSRSCTGAIMNKHLKDGELRAVLTETGWTACDTWKVALFARCGRKSFRHNSADRARAVFPERAGQPTVQQPKQH